MPFAEGSAGKLASAGTAGDVVMTGAGAAAAAAAGGRSGSAGARGPGAGTTAGATAGAGGNAVAGAAAISGQGGASGGAGASGSAGATVAPTSKFSFFVTSIEAIRELSQNGDGFGGDLRYGQPSGLEGADKLCTEIAERSLPGAGAKGWRAFLSAAKGGSGGGPVHAKDRIGTGPWYDRTERLVAMNLTALLQTRPMGADPAIANNLPNERGEPNQSSSNVDNHDMLTGSNAKGEYDQTATCEDWTSTTLPEGQQGPRVGHAWPGGSGVAWMSAHLALGCAPSVSLRQGAGAAVMGVGSLGGYGGFYCFALMP